MPSHTGAVRAGAVTLTFTALFASLAFGQTPAEPSLDRVVPFPQIGAPQDLQSVATMIRTIATIRDVSADETQKTVTVHGTTWQVALAEWLGRDLNQPVHDSGPHEYYLPGSNEVVRVFYAAGIENGTGLNETMTAIRTIGGIQLMMPLSSLKAMVIRGTQDQAALVDWLFHELDKPAGGQPPSQQGPNSAKLEYWLPPDPRGPSYERSAKTVVRIFYAAHIETPQGVLETMNAIRTIGGISLMMPVISLKAVVMRGTAEQAALVEWLFQELDKPADWLPAGQPSASSATREYVDQFNGPNVVCVFYLTNRNPMDILTPVRSALDLQIVMPVARIRAIVLRAPADKATLAGKMVKDLDK